MKSIRMFGLFAVGALVAMAFVGPSAAMAEKTTLCAAEESVCASKNIVKHVHLVTTGSVKIKFPGLPTVECNELFLGDELESGGPPLAAHGSWTVSSCNNLCVREESSSTIFTLRTATELASVTYEELFKVKCPFINCNYVGIGLEGHGLGPLTSKSGANGSVVITEQSLEKESGSLCPEEAFLTLTTTPLSATYISS